MMKIRNNAYLILLLVIVFFLSLFFWTKYCKPLSKTNISADIKESFYNNDSVFTHTLSSAIIIKSQNDSTKTKVVNWDIAEKILDSYIQSLYINDTVLRKRPDTLLCQNIVNYYVLNNPTDGYLSEILSITTYKLFYDNDSLCSSLRSYMQQKKITHELQDTIWIRIANDIIGNIYMEDEEKWANSKKLQHFAYFMKNGYIFSELNKYEPYCW